MHTTYNAQPLETVTTAQRATLQDACDELQRFAMRRRNDFHECQQAGNLLGAIGAETHATHLLALADALKTMHTGTID